MIQKIFFGKVYINKAGVSQHNSHHKKSSDNTSSKHLTRKR